MRDCPFCRNEVPVGAPRCKHCFGDLVQDARKGGGGSLSALFTLLLLFAAIGTWVWFSTQAQPQLAEVSIDGGEKRIVLVTRMPAGGFEANQVFFDDIANVEMEANEYSMGGTHFEVYVVKNGGERVLVNKRDEESLQPYAIELSERLDKQLTVVDNIRSVHSGVSPL
jgi:hypothetical protein